MAVRAHVGMLMRDAIALARDLGATVRTPRRTGELVFDLPAGRVRVNGRRKDAPTALAAALMRAERGER